MWALIIKIIYSIQKDLGGYIPTERKEKNDDLPGDHLQ